MNASAAGAGITTVAPPPPMTSYHQTTPDQRYGSSLTHEQFAVGTDHNGSHCVNLTGGSSDLEQSSRLSFRNQQQHAAHEILQRHYYGFYGGGGGNGGTYRSAPGGGGIDGGLGGGLNGLGTGLNGTYPHSVDLVARASCNGAPRYSGHHVEPLHEYYPGRPRTDYDRVGVSVSDVPRDDSFFHPSKEMSCISTPCTGAREGVPPTQRLSQLSHGSNDPHGGMYSRVHLQKTDSVVGPTLDPTADGVLGGLKSQGGGLLFNEVGDVIHRPSAQKSACGPVIYPWMKKIHIGTGEYTFTTTPTTRIGLYLEIRLVCIY